MRTCRGDGLWVSSGGEVMIMRIGSEKNFNGAWCDTPSTDVYNSICKAPISNKWISKVSLEFKLTKRHLKSLSTPCSSWSNYTGVDRIF